MSKCATNGDYLPQTVTPSVFNPAGSPPRAADRTSATRFRLDRDAALMTGCCLLRQAALLPTGAGSGFAPTAAVPGRFGSLPVSMRLLLLDQSGGA